MQKKKKIDINSGAWQRTLLIALCSVLAVIFIVLVIGTAYVYNMLNRLGRVDPDNQETLSDSQVENMMSNDPDLETIDPNSTETIPHIDDVGVTDDIGFVAERHGDHVINILLVGQDRREGEGRQRSDSMILVSFNTKKNTITLTSFMRDQYVQIPGYLNNKLNAAYAFGGFKLLNATLEKNFGVFVDGNVEVDFFSFAAVVDMLGGVEINLTQAEVEHLYLSYGWTFNVGPQILNGEQALAYSRIRAIDSDYRRAERQRTVLVNLLERYKDQTPATMLSILQEILPMVITDMSNSQILSLAGDLLPMISTATVSNLRIPVDGTFQQGDVQVRDGLKNWFQYNIDFAANYQILQMVFAD